MQFSPRQVDGLSLWEFVACLDAFRGWHGIKKKKTPEPSDGLLATLGISD